TRMGTRVASLPAAFASPACSSPDSATCRVFGKVTSCAIAGPNLARRDGPIPAPRREVAPERKRAPDCRFAGRHPDCSREPVGRSGGGGRGGRDPLSPAGFELFSAEDGNKMTSIFETVAHHWKGGGFGMYPIAICLVFAIAVII